MQGAVIPVVQHRRRERAATLTQLAWLKFQSKVRAGEFCFLCICEARGRWWKRSNITGRGFLDLLKCRPSSATFQAVFLMGHSSLARPRLSMEAAHGEGSPSVVSLGRRNRIEISSPDARFFAGPHPFEDPPSHHSTFRHITQASCTVVSSMRSQ